MYPENSCNDKTIYTAAYGIVEALFNRDLLTKYTWTGTTRTKLTNSEGNASSNPVDRGSKAAFKVFGNISSMLTAILDKACATGFELKKLQEFLQNKIFKYAKQRSTSMQKRVQTARTRNKKKGIIGNTDTIATADEVIEVEIVTDNAQVDNEHVQSEQAQTDVNIDINRIPFGQFQFQDPLYSINAAATSTEEYLDNEAAGGGNYSSEDADEEEVEEEVEDEEDDDDDDNSE